MYESVLPGTQGTLYAPEKATAGPDWWVGGMWPQAEFISRGFKESSKTWWGERRHLPLEASFMEG